MPACRRFCWLVSVLLAGPAFRADAQESVYNGAFPGFSGSMQNARDFEEQSGKGLSIIHFFRNWEDGNGFLGFPTSMMNSVRNHGAMPMVSWQPQGHRADSHYRLANIIDGHFDNSIRNWALAAKAWGHPFFLRFAHEMNGTWYPWCEGVNGNTSGQYVAAWRHVRDIFTRNGVTNVTWVWCPNTVYSGSVPLPGLYPGDNYVDWTSTDAYNRITNNWGHFSARAGPTLTQLLNIASGKPIMIGETGCHRDNDKSGVPAGSKAQWFRTAMKSYLKDQRPEIKAWVYFNGNNPDGNNWRIDSSPDVLEAYRESIGLSYYSDNKYGSITESPIRPLLNDARPTDTMGPFVSIDKPLFNVVRAGATVEIYTSASDKSGIQKIEYRINGTLRHTENLAPYQYFWPVPSGAGASYTIVARAYDTAGNTSESTVTVVSRDAPAAPGGVSATDGVHGDRVAVTWNGVAMATNYEIWRSNTDDTAGAVKLNANAVTGTLWNDYDAAHGVTYYYWIRALDDAGPGPFSAADTGFRAPVSAPPAPTGLWATDGSHEDRVQLGWNGSAGAAGYEIWRNTVNSSATAGRITAAAVTGTSFNDTTAAYSVRYYYWAKAVNEGGASPFSGVAAGYRGNVPPATVWNATGTASALDWSAGGNWIGGSAPQSGDSTNIAYFVDAAIPAGMIVSHHNAASPFRLNSLLLSGAGPEDAMGTVRITGGTLDFRTGGGRAPVVDLSAAGAGLTYRLETPLALSSTTEFRGDGSAELIVAGSIGGAGGLAKAGAGTLVLAGANTYSGATGITGGTLRIAHGNALGATAGGTTIPTGGGGRLTLAGGISVAEPLTIHGRNSGEHLVNESGDNALTGALTLQTGGNDYFFHAEAGRLTLGGPVTMVNSSASKTLHVSGDGDLEISGSLGNTGGSLAISKTGAGTLRLSGTPAHHGVTSVTGGTLVVDGSLAATSGVTVGAGGTLSGSGTIGAATVIHGTHAPGVQTFTAPLAYAATSRLIWELAGNTDAAGSFDTVNAAGVSIADGARIDVALDSAGSTVDFTDAFWRQERTWTLLDAASVDGAFALGSPGSDAAGRPAVEYGVFALQQTGWVVNLVWTPSAPPLRIWRETHFGGNWDDPEISGDDADPDKDGIPNLIEYALGTSPVAANGSGIAAAEDEGHFSITYTRLKSATDITARPLWSTDLLIWHEDGVIEQTLADDGTVRTIQAKVPTDANPKIYMRLRITRP